MIQVLRKVLVVDDNRLYREAIRRNLEFVDYQVSEAEDQKTALEEIRIRHPQVVITDLDMTHRTEGLDLIREIKSRYPLIPVILVSAVGSFEEGALAHELGATAVISKSRIDQELERLYECLDQVFDQIRMLSSLKARFERMMDNFEATQATPLEEEINRLIGSIKFDNSIKGELYEWVSHLRDRALAALGTVTPQAASHEATLGRKSIAAAGLLSEVEKILGSLDTYDPETQAMLLAAEQIYNQVGLDTDSGLARNAGFSYSFTVENEVKQRLGKRLARFISLQDLKKIVRQLYDPVSDSLTLGFSRYLLLNRNVSQDLTPDLAKQILERISKHGEKYKADGLKALGVIIHLFGRDHAFNNIEGPVQIRNPLGLVGLPPDEVTLLGLLLIRLQHTRNPYIHPEFSEREKLSEMRKLVMECLNLVRKIKE
jgi:CheY-like chemotaxis protein